MIGSGDRETSSVVKKANRKLDNNDVAGAIDVLEKAIEKKEDLFEAYLKRSFIRHYYLNEIDGAISDLDKASEIRPDDVDVYISRASLKKRFKKDFVGALDDYGLAQKYKPDSVILRAFKADVRADLNDLNGAIAEIKDGLRDYPENIDLNYRLAIFLVRKSDTDQAISHLRSFLKNYTEKRNGNLPKIRGVTVKKKIPREFKDDGSAINAILVTRYTQADLYVTSPRDFQKQMSEMIEAGQISNVFLLAGRLLISLDRSDEAFENLNKALEIDRNQEEAYGLRGILYLSRNNTKEAIAEFGKAIRIADVPYFYLNRGIAYLIERNDKKAEKDFEKFLKLFPAGNTVLDQRISEAKELIK